ncbi:hypothetical protein ACGRL8_08240 [Vibrio rumoiensis]|uniref:Uncharacterized protein n=1 Tax=Vibrio rumoiensis TaxID=76258 RepID=A0ABW7IV32_9VIBR|nr:hypothetical protein [Vibrio rumoiensis]
MYLNGISKNSTQIVANSATKMMLISEGKTLNHLISFSLKECLPHSIPLNASSMAKMIGKNSVVSQSYFMPSLSRCVSSLSVDAANIIKII